MIKNYFKSVLRSLQRPPKALVFSLFTIMLLKVADAQKSNSISEAAQLIKSSDLRTHISVLASDSLKGRATGTKEYDQAASYVVSKFKSAGLVPGIAKDWVQQVPLRKMEIDISASFLEIIPANGPAKKFQINLDFFIPSDYSQLKEVRSAVVFVGYGISAPETGYDDYAGINVRGKLVAYLPGTPPAMSKDERTYYAELKVKYALDHGAIGTLLLVPTIEEAISPLSLLGHLSSNSNIFSWIEPKEMDGKPAGLKMSVQLGLVATQELFAGSGSTYNESISNKRSIELPSKVHIVIKVRKITDVYSPNVIGLLEGSDPVLRNEYVVISAHLDHLGIGKAVNGDSIYNGTIDNASGVSALIEIAHALASLKIQPKRSIFFVAFTGEEPGDIGSDYFVHHCPVPLKKVIANINIDGISPWPWENVIANGTEHSSLLSLAETSAIESGVKLIPDPMPEKSSLSGSDQYSFIKQGIPSVILSARGNDPEVRKIKLDWVNNRYHHPSDDMEQPLDFNAAAKFTRTLLYLAYNISASLQRPKWNVNDFFGKRFLKSK